MVMFLEGKVEKFVIFVINIEKVIIKLGSGCARLLSSTWKVEAGGCL